MRIGEMTSMMMMISKNQNNFAKKFNQAEMQLATGKRVNQASDDPSAIGRIERTKSQLNESKIIQKSLDDVMNRNSTMETTLNALSDHAQSLSDLATESTQPGADTATIQSQAKDLLDSMVSLKSSTEYNGQNPFTQGSISFGVSGGSQVTVNSPKFNIVQNATNSGNYDITLNDGTVLSDKSVSDILNSNFIKTNLTDQVSGAKSSVGTSNNILGFRKTFEANKEDILTKTLSALEDADLGQATVQSNVASQMMSMNQNMFASYSNMFQSQVGSLFNVRV